MGCPPRFNPDRGKMVEKRSQFPHQYSETKSSNPSMSGSCSISQGTSHLFQHRQLYSHVSCKQARGTRSQTLSNLAMELWNYALNRNLIISVTYIPGKLNVLADQKSRIFKDSIEWMLNQNVFRGVVARLGRPDIRNLHRE